MGTFFTKPKRDETYLRLLEEVALAQRALFLDRFDWAKRAPHTTNAPKKGLFHRKPKETEVVLRKKQALANLKNSIVTHRRDQGLPSGLFWWQMPYEQVEQYLIYDIGEAQGQGQWRYERSWQTTAHNGIHTLLLKEEGHCSNFSTSSSYDVTQESKYSHAERSEMEQRFNRGLRDRDLYKLATVEGPVHSITTGADYQSYADYVLSSEYATIRSIQRDSYARSLYTEHHTDTHYVVSHSIHYEAVYAVADYGVSDDGVLHYLKIHHFSFQGGKGDLSEAIVQQHSSRDAAVAAAAYLADNPQVSAVPLTLFGKEIAAAVVDYDEAMRQAEIYTCLGEKMRYAD